MRIIKRKLLSETSDILRNLINELELEDTNYLFYFFKFKDVEPKRYKFLHKK